MTQRIFDIENEKDMQDLWEILPDDVSEIRKGGGDSELDNTFFFKNGYISRVIKINWHDKTEITRPVNYEDMIGCVGWFEKGDFPRIGILTKVNGNDEDGYCYCMNNNIWCKSFTPAKKSELKFYGD
jgi:hypothetical protein